MKQGCCSGGKDVLTWEKALDFAHYAQKYHPTQTPKLVHNFSGKKKSLLIIEKGTGKMRLLNLVS